MIYKEKGLFQIGIYPLTLSFKNQWIIKPFNVSLFGLNISSSERSDNYGISIIGFSLTLIVE